MHAGETNRGTGWNVPLHDMILVYMLALQQQGSTNPGLITKQSGQSALFACPGLWVWLRSKHHHGLPHLSEELLLQLEGPPSVRPWGGCQVPNVCTFQYHLHTHTHTDVLPTRNATCNT